MNEKLSGFKKKLSYFDDIIIMLISEIFSCNNELLIFVRMFCLCCYYNLFYVVIMIYYFVGIIYYFVCMKFVFIFM